MVAGFRREYPDACNFCHNAVEDATGGAVMLDGLDVMAVSLIDVTLAGHCLLARGGLPTVVLSVLMHKAHWTGGPKGDHRLLTDQYYKLCEDT